MSKIVILDPTKTAFVSTILYSKLLLVTYHFYMNSPIFLYHSQFVI